MITIIAGTNRPDSNSRALADLYAEMLLQKCGVKSQILDLRELPIDFTTTALYDQVGSNLLFNQLAELLDHSDKFVFVMPEYNGSFPGVLKAFIDGLSYPNALRHKKAVLVAFSNGTQGGLLAMSHLTDILNYLGMHVMANKVRIPQIQNHLIEKKLVTPFYEELLEEQAKQFLSF